MSEEIDLSNERSELVKKAAQGETVVSGSRGIMEPTDQVARIEIIDKQRKQFREKMDELNTFCTRLYRLRNACLMAGYVAFLSHTIWLPYYNNG